MASYITTKFLITITIIVFLVASCVHAQLSPSFYSKSCPNLQSIVSAVMAQLVAGNPTVGPSILRLFFHDCFVNGCDASVLLDDTPTFIGEKNAPPNKLSLRGYEFIDVLKIQVEALCPKVVSCADILALSAQEAVYLLGGPSWKVALGRRDAKTTNIFAAVSNLPSPSASFESLKHLFGSKGLTPRDMVALSGAHTIGQARCTSFRAHVYKDRDVDPDFAFLRQQTCPTIGGDAFLAPLDAVTPTLFDNSYHRNLVLGRGLLHSDQQLYSSGEGDDFVSLYARNQTAFFEDFASAMVKMGSLHPVAGRDGEIRVNCHLPN